MQFVEVGVIADKYTAHGPAASQGDKCRGVAVQIERVFFPVEKLFDLDQQRRNPMRIAFSVVLMDIEGGVTMRTPCSL